MKIKRFLHFLWPQRCAACSKLIKADTYLCEGCSFKLSYIIAPVCKFCGVGKDRCKCKKHKHEYTKNIAPFYYEDSGERVLANLKFRNMTANAKFVAEEIARLIETEYSEEHFELIACVPLSAARLRERGYNQSDLIAKELSKIIGTPYNAKAIVKVQNNKSQHKLSGIARAGNVFGVYEARAEIVKNKTVLLVDDILTTGATIGECAKMLRLAGAEEVFCVTGAITAYRGL
jgi:competence protein ComFC